MELAQDPAHPGRPPFLTFLFGHPQLVTPSHDAGPTAPHCISGTGASPMISRDTKHRLAPDSHRNTAVAKSFPARRLEAILPLALLSTTHYAAGCGSGPSAGLAFSHWLCCVRGLGLQRTPTPSLLPRTDACPCRTPGETAVLPTTLSQRDERQQHTAQHRTC